MKKKKKLNQDQEQSMCKDTKEKEGKQTNNPVRESKDAEPQLQTPGVIT